MGNTSSSSAGAGGHDGASTSQSSRSRSSRSSRSSLPSRRLRSPWGIAQFGRDSSTRAAGTAAGTGNSNNASSPSSAHNRPPRPGSNNLHLQANGHDSPSDSAHQVVAVEDTVVDAGHTVPRNKLYHAQYHYDSHVVAAMIQQRKLAPFYDGLPDIDERELEALATGIPESDNHTEEFIDKSQSSSPNAESTAGMTSELKRWVVAVGGAVECPICFLFYPKNINYASCCDQPICTECFVQIKRAERNEEAACPYCVVPGFAILYLPPIVYMSSQRNTATTSIVSLPVATSPVPIQTDDHRKSTVDNNTVLLSPDSTHFGMGSSTGSQAISFSAPRPTYSTPEGGVSDGTLLITSNDTLSSSAPDAHRHNLNSSNTFTVTATTHTRRIRTLSANSAMMIHQGMNDHTSSSSIHQIAELPRSRSNTAAYVQTSTTTSNITSNSEDINDRQHFPLTSESPMPGFTSLSSSASLSERSHTDMDDVNKSVEQDRARKVSIKSSRASLVTSDAIRPAYILHLQQQYQIQAMREHQEAAIARVRRYLLNNNNSNNNIGGDARRSSRSDRRTSIPSQTSSSDPFSPGSLLSNVINNNTSNSSSNNSRRQRNSMSRTANVDRGYTNAMRTIGADLEELMIMEAVQQSVLDEEERERKVRAESETVLTSTTVHAHRQGNVSSSSTINSPVTAIHSFGTMPTTTDNVGNSTVQTKIEDDNEPLIVTTTTGQRQLLTSQRNLNSTHGSALSSSVIPALSNTGVQSLTELHTPYLVSFTESSPVIESTSNCEVNDAQSKIHTNADADDEQPLIMLKSITSPVSSRRLSKSSQITNTGTFTANVPNTSTCPATVAMHDDGSSVSDLRS